MQYVKQQKNHGKVASPKASQPSGDFHLAASLASALTEFLLVSTTVTQSA
jgi:hypothetical protein